MIYIGKLIEEELIRQGRTKSWLAKELNTNRVFVYSLFKKKSIDTDLLLRISQLLKVDFFAMYERKYNENV